MLRAWEPSTLEKVVIGVQPDCSLFMSANVDYGGLIDTSIEHKHDENYKPRSMLIIELSSLLSFILGQMVTLKREPDGATAKPAFFSSGWLAKDDCQKLALNQVMTTLLAP